MAAKLSSCFLSHGWMRLNSNHSNVRFFFPSHTLRPASCKKRQRNFSSQHKRQIVKKASPDDPRIDAEVQLRGDEDTELENTSTNEISSLTQDIVVNDAMTTKQVDENDLSSLMTQDVKDFEMPPLFDSNSFLTLPVNNRTPYRKDPTPAGDTSSMNMGFEEKFSTIQLEDLIGMIRNAEKNILLLNQARVCALENLQNILKEKEALQGEINILEMRVAETDAKIKVAAQEKILVELLKEQLHKMRMELSGRVGSKASKFDMTAATDVPQLQKSNIHDLTEELSSLRVENMSSKGNVEAIRAELSNAMTADERVVMLEREHSLLEFAMKELELKLAATQEDVTKFHTLKLEYNKLWEKVENLQALLDKAAKQADQAILVMQQNHDLRKKVDHLEEFLQEANIYKLSSEKMQKYNELLQQKIKLLEERLEKSDEEIQSYVQLYQESIKEFQEILNRMKEESKKRALDEPVSDMPWEFWSRLLLMIDGWLLENKLSSSDAKMLREMVWKRDRRAYDTYLICKGKNEDETLAVFLRLTSNPTSSGLHIIHIAAEVAPVAKVGGLGDVVTGLSKSLQKKGHLVEIVVPKYDCMQYDLIRDFRALDVVVESYFDRQLFRNKIWVGTVEGLPVYFIEPHHPLKFFWRGQYYGEHDDFKRFSFFSRAALELLLKADKKPDIIHCHDWQTAFVAPLYWEIYAHKGLNSARLCFTCHNFEYQGTAPASELASCGLDVNHLNTPDRMQDSSAHDRVNPVKGAIVFSNIVTTVSPTYAEEVQTPEGGRGLHTTLNSHSRKFMGILNGIDTDLWNPATDTFLKVQYNSTDLQGKSENKEALKKLLELSSADATQPLIGCISRLVPQKGVHLIRHAIYRTIELGGQFVLLGSSPVHHIQREFEGIASHFQSHEHARLILKYDESLSRMIYGASDMFIIPSIFEPCGLTQMIAMRYGSIPIARKTGGLNDSVFDVDDESIPVQFRNGFTFSTPDEQGVNSALDRALSRYKEDRASWQQLVHKVMSIDFSWDSSASEYEELYHKSVARARAAKRA
ncbi:hypothetical protein Nepgr_029310 [Nepenthes gracilis]|uniref:starch synthase n=1 Tax=Nepenthes gracilis TaxID=150966 RepID=A0AAD3TF49_NEPGR|nr:hypothetical protein Nepgr_029310 [Nepenthes gracilis]